MPHRQEQNLRLRSEIKSAEGFYELEMWDDAWMELDKLAHDDRGHPLVILFEMDILLAQHRFDEAVTLGRSACERWPILDGFFFKTTAALIDLADYAPAKETLLAAPESLRQKAAYWFDLARCQYQLGEIDHARESVSECIRRDKGFKLMVRNSPDLQLLWKEI